MALMVVAAVRKTPPLATGLRLSPRAAPGRCSPADAASPVNTTSKPSRTAPLRAFLLPRTLRPTSLMQLSSSHFGLSLRQRHSRLRLGAEPRIKVDVKHIDYQIHDRHSQCSQQRHG